MKFIHRYFDKAPVRDYDGGRTSQDFIDFLLDPDNPKAGSSGGQEAPKDPEEEWKGLAGAEHVKHLGEKDFQGFLDGKRHALVMFYAPW